MHLVTQNGGHSQPNGVRSSLQNYDNSSNSGMCWVSPELALNLGLACHLHPFLVQSGGEAADGTAAGPTTDATVPLTQLQQQQPASLDAVVIQPYAGDSQPSVGADASANTAVLHPTVSIPVPGGQTAVRAAAAVTLAQLREPEPHPLPAEGEAAGGEPSGADAGDHRHDQGGAGGPPPAEQQRSAPGGGKDAGFGAALTVALRRHFQASSVPKSALQRLQ